MKVKKFLILATVLALLAVLAIPAAAFATDTEINGNYVAATINVTPPGTMSFSVFNPGENTNVISNTGTVTVTNNSQSPSGWTVNAIDNASYGYMRVGGPGSSPYLATKLRIGFDAQGWAWADVGQNYSAGPATGNFDFYARQDVTNTDSVGTYWIFITFTGSLSF
jgi:hypothetical protein